MVDSLIFATFLVVVGYVARLLVRPRGKDCCPHCGYNLSGHTRPATCPECGVAEAGPRRVGA